MPRLYLDEQEIQVSSGEANSLEQILKEIEDEHLPPNTVIRQIHVDGTPLLAEDFANEPSDVLAQVAEKEKIEVFTGSIGEVAEESVYEAIDYLKRVESSVPALISGFRSTPGPEAFESLRQLYEGFYWLNLLLDRLETTLEFDVASFEVQGVAVHAQHVKLAGVLKEMVSSQEREDYVLVADLLEYEVLPLVTVWKDMYAAIGDRIAAVP